jgi:hypothetical protein
MMKTFITIMLIILGVFGTSYGKDIDVSITPQVGYAQGTWGSGLLPSPTGTMHDDAIMYGGAFQVIYNGWKFKPTIEIQWDSGKFDFATWQAPSQGARQNIYSARVGVTKGLGWNTSVYGLVGFTWSHVDGRLTEIIRDRCHYKVFPHGKGAIKIDDRGASFKFGAYKLFNIIESIKAGPEISVEIFPKALGFSRCREFDSGNILPWGGIRVQW